MIEKDGEGNAALSVERNDHILAKVDEKVIFKPYKEKEFKCGLHIKNISAANSPIIYKIKPTSPSRYRLDNDIAVIEAGAIAKVLIVSVPGISKHQINQDRFTVQVVSLPKRYLDSNDNGDSMSNKSRFADVHSLFQNILSSGKEIVETFNVTVGTAEARRPTCGQMLIISEDAFKNELVILEEKITKDLDNKIDTQLNLLQKRVYIILALLGIFCIWMIFNLVFKQCPYLEPDYCRKICPTNFVPKSECCGWWCQGLRWTPF